MWDWGGMIAGAAIGGIAILAFWAAGHLDKLPEPAKDGGDPFGEDRTAVLRYGMTVHVGGVPVRLMGNVEVWMPYGNVEGVEQQIEIQRKWMCACCGRYLCGCYHEYKYTDQYKTKIQAIRCLSHKKEFQVP